MSQFSLDPKNVAQVLDVMPDGNSWRQEIDGFTISALRDSTGIPLTGATAPLVEISSGELRAKSVASTTHTVYATLQVPRSYDNSRGKTQLMVQMVIAGSAGTDAPSVTLTATARPMTGAVKTGYAPTNPTGTASTSATTLSWDLSTTLSSASVKIKGGDTVTLKFVFGAHTTDDFYILALRAFATQGPNFQYRPARLSTYGTEQTSG